ncbi:MAG: NAD-dependent dehydratase, partial [Spirochaetes bacterium]|nr:NAD-dependent dehydratase [Spirochaetota bacterium]
QIEPSAKIVTEKERVRPGKSEVMQLLGSNKKIKELTDWEPKYDLKSGIKETIDWLKDHQDKYKPDIYNI